MVRSATADNQQKLHAMLITGLFVISLAILLKFFAFDIRKFSSEQLSKEIDFKIFTPEEKEKVKEEIPQETEPLPQEESFIIDDKAVSEMVSENEVDDLLKETQSEFEALIDRPIEEMDEKIIEDGGDIYDPGLDLIDTDGALDIGLGDLGDIGAGENVGGGIGLVRGGKATGFGTGTNVKIGGRKRATKEGKNVLDSGGITQIKQQKKGQKDWVAKKFIPEIEKWIKQNIKAVPGKIRLLLDFEQGDIQSIDNFECGGKNYKIFFLYRAGQSELRLCLIEKDQFVQLIDSGAATGGTNYLKIGNIIWKKDNTGALTDEILRYDAGQRLSPSDPRADQFYSVFLSWYEYKIGKK